MANVAEELRAENERLRGEQAATAEILRVINQSAGSIDAVLQAVADAAVRHCGADAARVRLWDGSFLTDGPASGPGDYVYQASPGGTRAALDNRSPAGRAIRSAKTVLMSDVLRQAAEDGADPELVERLRTLGQRSQLTIPLASEGEVFGVLNLAHLHEVRPFAGHEIALAETFAAQAAIAIANSRRMEALRESLEQQTATAEVLRIISSSPMDQERVLGALIENAVRLCQADIGNISLRDEDSMRRRAFFRDAGFTHEFAATLAALDASVVETDRAVLGHRSLSAAALRKGRTSTFYGSMAAYLAAFPDGGLGSPLELALGTLPLHGRIAVPLLHQGAAIGVFYLQRRLAEPFSDSQIALLESFADQAVIAIENARLFNELKRSNKTLGDALEQQTATAAVLRVIADSPGDVDSVLQAITESATRLLGADEALVYMLHEGHVTPRAATSTLPGRERLMEEAPRHPGWSGSQRLIPAVQAIIDNRSYHLHGDPSVYEAQFPYAAKNAAELGLRTMLVVPLSKEGSAVGAIMVRRRDPAPFNAPEVALIETFADQAVIALENARLFNELERRNRDLSGA